MTIWVVVIEADNTGWLISAHSSEEKATARLAAFVRDSFEVCISELERPDGWQEWPDQKLIDYFCENTISFWATVEPVQLDDVI